MTTEVLTHRIRASERQSLRKTEPQKDKASERQSLRKTEPQPKSLSLGGICKEFPTDEHTAHL